MTGRLAELDDNAIAETAEDMSMRTVNPDAGTQVEDLRSLSMLWRVKKTQIKMMEDRNYHLTPFDVEFKEKATTSAAFWQLLTEKIPSLNTSSSSPATFTAIWDLLTQTYVSKNDRQVLNLVVFLPRPLGKAFPTLRLNRVISMVKKEPTIRYLDVIYEFPMTKLVRSKLSVTNRVVAEWSYPDLLMPVVNSVYLGSSFRVLTPQEFNEYYKADPVMARGGLPILCRDDPLVRYHQWTVDTIIRSTEIGDVNVAVTRLLKDYIVSNSTIFAAIDSAEQPAA